MAWSVIRLYNMGQYNWYFGKSFIIHSSLTKSNSALLYLPIDAPLTSITKLNQRNPVQNINTSVEL